MWRVLCVDDDPAKATQIGQYLSEWEDSPWGGFEFEIASSFDEAISRIKRERFDLITLDLHGEGDPQPQDDDGTGDQVGRRILEGLKDIRFVPVIFYTGFAEKIKSITTGVVKVVQKGGADLDKVRSAVSEIMGTKLPSLARRIEDDTREYMWGVVDREWNNINDGSEIAYLLARRLAATFGHVAVKDILGHDHALAHPIEFYIYPPLDEKIRTGCIVRAGEGKSYWIVATPACDFVERPNKRLDNVLLIGAHLLTEDQTFKEWRANPSGSKRSDLDRLVKNNKGDRYRFLPGTFFVPDLVVDMQRVWQIPIGDFERLSDDIVCRLDSPYREEFLLHVSRYYGRIGTPDLDHSALSIFA